MAGRADRQRTLVRSDGVVWSAAEDVESWHFFAFVSLIAHLSQRRIGALFILRRQERLMRSRPAADLALPTGWIVGTYISRCFITRMPLRHAGRGQHEVARVQRDEALVFVQGEYHRRTVFHRYEN